MELTVGDDAPDFTLPGDGGRTLSLAAHRGKIVVLFFYPKDNTPSCTTEAIDFSALEPQFASIGATVIGISPDPVKSHDRFKAKQGLTVPLAADEAMDILRAYGVWGDKQMYGRTYQGVIRTTVLIDRDGKIARVWSKVRVKDHAAEVLEAARQLG